jgi:hypothetical protein
MKANELRIGNSIQYSNDGTHFIVDSISETGLDVHNDVENTWIEIDQFELGYKKDELGLFYFDSGGDFSGEFVVRFLRGDIDIAPFAERNPEPGSIFQSISIQYVHELQNIYFFLSGSELTIKETAKE